MHAQGRVGLFPRQREEEGGRRQPEVRAGEPQHPGRERLSGPRPVHLEDVSAGGVGPELA